MLQLRLLTCGSLVALGLALLSPAAHAEPIHWSYASTIRVIPPGSLRWHGENSDNGVLWSLIGDGEGRILSRGASGSGTGSMGVTAFELGVIPSSPYVFDPDWPISSLGQTEFRATFYPDVSTFLVDFDLTDEISGRSGRLSFVGNLGGAAGADGGDPAYSWYLRSGVIGEPSESTGLGARPGTAGLSFPTTTDLSESLVLGGNRYTVTLNQFGVGKNVPWDGGDPYQPVPVRVDVSPAAAPEPSGLVLAALGLVGVAFLVRRLRAAPCPQP